MARVDDVAAYIVSKTGTITTWKLQKLVYYSQAWHLVWEERPLFDDPIEAWANGPVVRALYDRHRGDFRVATWTSGEPTALDEGERTSIDAVLGEYGDKTGAWLSSLTHREPPWLEARAGLSAGERGDSVITHQSMSEYYGGLL